ncbi:hypothetical protein [Halobacillus karajensis]|uniref:hypothetical protein n=1 Tax=Halobacillus karajensis TaxID=195088 RepID=UPI00045CA654|nr:hypothetical protein [Halobacillus karajensis]CDQ17972.1 hypothetical protein BN982_00212 [Halobacillus karajensis]
MQCIRCQREPKEIQEYVDQANEMEMSPHEYVRMDEGTYDIRTDMFCCTKCYVQMGAPLLINLLDMYENVIPFEAKK